MNSENVCDSPRWYVIYTHPKQEDRAESNLRAWGVETFNIKVREGRFNQYSGARSYVTKPLFSRYIFARFEASKLLHKVYFTRGVNSVVSFDSRPTPVDDDIINLMRSRMGSDGFVQIGEQLSVGDKVMIKSGPMANLVGVFERELKDTDRVSILLTAINYQGRVVIESELIQKVS